ncbi:hypothetical protein Tsubulata_037690 [Turnera subulata]|uniref:RWP-RK domain-containing protein n=1 Tax=Turnera subulata TaxID=218843 RepID=A0A9Q0G1J4_9ROSI|nr:hypothetical protein Tsubulata_037690 [Turnera subulata]
MNSQQQATGKAATATATPSSSASTNPNSNPNPPLLTLDDISTQFSVPLSDAANNLGVCVSVLKKICRENGLDRWPYRKFLAGKTIEDIKKHAIRERNKGLAELAKSGRQSGSQHQSNENAKLQGAMSPQKLQQGSNILPGRQPIIITPALTKGLLGSDEFKYGFPRDGLSTVSDKWWGRSPADGNTGIEVVGTETDDDGEHQSEEKVDGAGSLSVLDRERPENGKAVDGIDASGNCLLTTVRKRTVEEGREALKLGVYRAYGVKKIGRRQRALLVLIFGSSLPNR